MNENSQMSAMLQMIDRPAFFASGGKITQVNTPARLRLIEPGADLSSIFVTGSAEYQGFERGCLYLTIAVAGCSYTCSVTKMDTQDLFVLEQGTDSNSLNALALAAEHLRIPLSDLILSVDNIANEDDPKKAKLYHALYKLQRVIGNMSDAAYAVSSPPKLEQIDVVSVFREVLEKSTTLSSQGSNIHIKYNLPKTPVYTLVDRALLSRAIYNTISNAIKFAPSGAKIDISVYVSGDKLYFSVVNPVENPALATGDMFIRYNRSPGIQDSRFGIGLGMTMVHAAASAHGGAVLVRQHPGNHLETLMTLSLRKSKNATLRAPVLRPDNYGGQDQALVELSDILSSNLYGGNDRY